jgi:hypothetical protein
MSNFTEESHPMERKKANDKRIFTIWAKNICKSTMHCSGNICVSHKYIKKCMGIKNTKFRGEEGQGGHWGP